MLIAGKKLSALQRKIIEAKQELGEFNKLEQPIPELINTTNMLRTNEYLSKANEKKSKLLVTFEEYAKELEKLVLSTSTIKAKIKALKIRSKAKKKLKNKIKTKKRHLQKRKKTNSSRKKSPKRRVKKSKTKHKIRKNRR